MTASQEAKALGLKSLALVSRLTGKPQQTLRNWHRDEYELFRIALLGCVALLEMQHAA